MHMAQSVLCGLSRADSPDIDLSSPRSFIAKSRSTSVVIFGAKLLVIYGRLQRYILSHRDGGRLTAACDGGGCPGGGGAGAPSGGKSASCSRVARAAAANRGGIGGGIGGIGGGPAGRGGADTPAPAPLGALLKSGSNKSINLFFIVALPPLGVNAGAFADIPRPLSPPEDDADADADTADASPRTEPLVSSSAPSPSPSTPKMRSRANLYSSSRSSAVRVSTLPDVDFDLARASIAALESPSAFPSSPSRVGLARTATRTFRRALDSVAIASRRVVVVVVVPTARARERKNERIKRTPVPSSLARDRRPRTDDRRPTTARASRRTLAVVRSVDGRARDRSIGRVSMGFYTTRVSRHPRVRATDRARRPRARVPTTTRGRGIIFLARASPSRARDDARIAWNRAKSRDIAIVDTSAPHPSRDDATSSVGARARASASNGSR